MSVWAMVQPVTGVLVRLDLGCSELQEMRKQASPNLFYLLYFLSYNVGVVRPPASAI